MSHLTKAKAFALDTIKQYPDLEEEINESWELMHDEINGGSSEEQEVELFFSELRCLIAEKEAR